MTTPEQVDLARAMVALARKLELYTAAYITETVSPSSTDALANVLDETVRQVRLYRP